MNAQANVVSEATAEPKKAKPKPVSEKVKMSDGREVEFSGVKRKMLKEAIFGSDGHWVGTQFDFRNGATVTYTPPASDLKTPEGQFLFEQLAAHGSLQKIGDETAGADTVAKMVDAVQECIDRLNAGEWFAEGAGAGAFGTSLLLRALVESTGKTAEALRPWLKEKTIEQKKAMKNSDRLRPIIQRLEAEDAAKLEHVNTDELFDELDNAA